MKIKMLVCELHICSLSSERVQNAVERVSGGVIESHGDDGARLGYFYVTVPHLGRSGRRRVRRELAAAGLGIKARWERMEPMT